MASRIPSEAWNTKGTPTPTLIPPIGVGGLEAEQARREGIKKV